MDIHHTNLFSRVVKFEQFIPSIFSVVEKKASSKIIHVIKSQTENNIIALKYFGIMKLVFSLFWPELSFIWR